MLNNIAVEKRIALSLYPLSWLDRFSMLTRLPSAIRLKVKSELNQLKHMNITDLNGLLEKVQGYNLSDNAPETKALSITFQDVGLSEKFEQALRNKHENSLDTLPLLCNAIDEALLEASGSRR